MGTLKEDIKIQSDWIVKALTADNFKLDYTIESFIELDRFFIKHSANGQAIAGGRLSKNLGSIIFSIGSYIGETIIKTVPGTEWETDDADPKGEMNASLRLPNGTEVWPMQRAMKRFKNGDEDSVYPYGHSVTQEFTNKSFNNEFWTLTRGEKKESKRKWKFW
jgi:hypothetical protein